jgi:hypothetical protein
MYRAKVMERERVLMKTGPLLEVRSGPVWFGKPD